MGNRAKVYYQTEQNKNQLHHSHYGATDKRLVDEITEDTPFANGAVNKEPDETDVESPFESVDTLHNNRLYIVDEDYNVTQYAVRWFSGKNPLTKDTDEGAFVKGGEYTFGLDESDWADFEDYIVSEFGDNNVKFKTTA